MMKERSQQTGVRSQKVGKLKQNGKVVIGVDMARPGASDHSAVNFIQRDWHKVKPNDLWKADIAVLPYNARTKAQSAVVNQHIIKLNPEINFLQECRIKCIIAEIEGIIHAGKPADQILILYKPKYLAADDQARIEYKVAEINAIIKDKNIK